MPTENQEVAGPLRLDLKAMLRDFLDFRFEVVTRRFEYELAELEAPHPHPRGLRDVFDALDETIRIIRKSDGKADAAEKLIKRFELDESRPTPSSSSSSTGWPGWRSMLIREELKREAGRGQGDRGDPRATSASCGRSSRRARARSREQYADKRRTKIGGGGGEEVEFDAEDFIVDEDVT